MHRIVNFAILPVRACVCVCLTGFLCTQTEIAVSHWLQPQASALHGLPPMGTSQSSICGQVTRRHILKQHARGARYTWPLETQTENLWIISNQVPRDAWRKQTVRGVHVAPHTQTNSIVVELLLK